MTRSPREPAPPLIPPPGESDFFDSPEETEEPKQGSIDWDKTVEAPAEPAPGIQTVHLPGDEAVPSCPASTARTPATSRAAAAPTAGPLPPATSATADGACAARPTQPTSITARCDRRDP